MPHAYTTSAPRSLLRRFWRAFIATLREQRITSFLGVFVIFYLIAALGQYMFYVGHGSPAVVWLPAGFALATVLIWGYRMWLPIATAQLTVALTSPVHLSLAIVIAGTIAYTLQSIVGCYVLRHQFDFEGALSRVMDALVFVGVAVTLPFLAPTIIGLVQLSLGEDSASLWPVLGHAWVGGVLSIMVITPCITTWFRGARLSRTRHEVVERIVAFAALAGTIYIIFWTPLPQQNVLISLYFFFTVLFWIGLRMGPRMLSLSIFFTAVFSVAGTIIVHPGTMPLNEQLLADELFMVLIAPIFIILAALVEERRIITQELTKKNTELQQALIKTRFEDRAKSEFLAILGHELRNPLAPITSTLELLKLDEPRLERIAMINQAEKQVGAMKHLLDDLLDVARIAQKKFSLKKEVVLLQDMIRQSAATIESFMGSQGVRLSITMPHEQLWMYADSARLMQVFNNTLHNAAKFTPRGGNIRLVLERDGHEAVVRVVDTGIGIARSKLTRIFDSFVSINSASQVTTGLGIGLSLSRRLVEMHGGSIEAHSDGPGTGSTFIMRLPLSKGTPLPMHPAPAVSRDRKSLGDALRILVVDDNEAAAQGIGKLLQYKGHEVRFAYTGMSALDATSTFHPDAVLLDIGLPDVSGYDVARRMRARTKEAPPVLIALTGYGQVQDKKEARLAGFAYHLTKPVGIADIEAILGRISARQNGDVKQKINHPEGS